MRKALVPAFLLVLGSLVLGATVLREPLANAAGSIPSVLISNDNAHALPVREQNLDASGNIAVHEQGTADVNVTNSTPPTPVTDGGGFTSPTGIGCDRTISISGTATALSIAMGPDVLSVTFKHGGSVAAQFAGPAWEGNASIELALTRPIAFDSIVCQGTGFFSTSWVGNAP